MKKYIIINGTMGAGKSTVGRRIAELLGCAAFIEGDFVVELHPHIDHSETEAMQRDNILHMSKNYNQFNKCNAVVLSWIMGETGAKKLMTEIAALNYEIYHVVLTCSKQALTERWHKDAVNDWRTGENLKMALHLLESFNKRTDCIFIDTSDLSVDMAAERIIESIHTTQAFIPMN